MDEKIFSLNKKQTPSLLTPSPFQPPRDDDFFMGGYTDTGIQSNYNTNCVCNPNSKCYNVDRCKQRLIANAISMDDFFNNIYSTYTDTEKKHYEDILSKYNAILDEQTYLDGKKDFISDPDGIDPPILYYPHALEKQDKIYKKQNIPDARTATYDDQERIIQVQKQFYIASGILMSFLLVSAIVYPMIQTQKR